MPRPCLRLTDWPALKAFVGELCKGRELRCTDIDDLEDLMAMPSSNGYDSVTSDETSVWIQRYEKAKIVWWNGQGQTWVNSVRHYRAYDARRTAMLKALP